MAMNYYEGWTESDLLTERRRAQEAQVSGRQTSWTSPDMASGSQVEVQIHVVLQRIQYALYLLNPTDYPLSGSKRVTRTRTQYV